MEQPDASARSLARVAVATSATADRGREEAPAVPYGLGNVAASRTAADPCVPRESVHYRSVDGRTVIKRQMTSIPAPVVRVLVDVRESVSARKQVIAGARGRWCQRCTAAPEVLAQLQTLHGRLQQRPLRPSDDGRLDVAQRRPHDRQLAVDDPGPSGRDRRQVHAQRRGCQHCVFLPSGSPARVGRWLRAGSNLATGRRELARNRDTEAGGSPRLRSLARAVRLVSPTAGDVPARLVVAGRSAAAWRRETAMGSDVILARVVHVEPSIPGGGERDS